jgi:M6 family metalloprotease-like protein
MLKQISIGFVLILALNTLLLGTTPPKDGGTMPDAYLRVQQQKPRAFTYKRALEPWLARVETKRALLRSSGAFAILGNMSAAQAALSVQGSPMISGSRSIPVLLVRFSNTTADGSGQSLFASSVLQRKLFDGEPSHPGTTIGDFYREMSYGLFTVRGTVYDWKELPLPDTFYEGQDYIGDHGLEHCSGLCPTAHLGELIKQALDLNANIDWGQYDNDGPDGVPNSGDDDGYVDFVAFAHAENGSECDRGTNIWSHRSSLSSWTGSDYVTRSPSAKGGFIRIDDYTIQPAYGCDRTTPNDIGVFAHEFGHAFGLPDLYDTSGRGQGVGNWCLMSGGSWGGDGQSPDQPVQMSPWAKEVLGWITPMDITADLTPASIATYEDHPDVYRLRISPTQYYLINNIGKKLSNSKLPIAGLQIWLVNQRTIDAGLRSNRVNSDPDNYGVELIEADGLKKLRTSTFRGGPGDLFPGSSDKRKFDSATNPKNIATTAVCEIVAPGDKALTSVLIGSNLCPGSATLVQPVPNPNVSTTAAAASNSPPRNQETTLVSEILANPQGFLDKEVQIVGKLENKGANIQLRKGRDFQFSDASGSIPVSIRLPLEVEKTNAGSSKAVVGDVLNETVRVIAQVESDPNTGRPRLAIKSAVVVRH